MNAYRFERLELKAVCEMRRLQRDTFELRLEQARSGSLIYRTEEVEDCKAAEKMVDAIIAKKRKMAPTKYEALPKMRMELVICSKNDLVGQVENLRTAQRVALTRHERKYDALAMMQGKKVDDLILATMDEMAQYERFTGVRLT
jgi:hypothetical protein